MEVRAGTDYDGTNNTGQAALSIFAVSDYLSTTLRHRRFLFTELRFSCLWKWRVTVDPDGFGKTGRVRSGWHVFRKRSG